MACGGWRRAQVVEYQFRAYGVPIMPQAKERFEIHVRILLPTFAVSVMMTTFPSSLRELLCSDLTRVLESLFGQTNFGITSD